MNALIRPQNPFASRIRSAPAAPPFVASMPAPILSHLRAMCGCINTDGRVVSASGDGLRCCGVAATDLPGKRFVDVFPETLEVAEVGSGSVVISGVSECGHPWFAEFFFFTDPDDSRRTGFFARDFTSLKALERHVVEAADAERRRIGAELHDNLGQQLTGIACLASALRKQLRNRDTSMAHDAEALAATAKEALQQTRALAREMRPGRSDARGLAVALARLSDYVRRFHGVHMSARVRGNRRDCDEHESLHLLRITQESVSNALRHGRAKNILVTLDTTSVPQRLLIEDDGCGFNPNECDGSGVGLNSMRSRAAQIGGRLTITSRPGAGTKVEFLLEPEIRCGASVVKRADPIAAVA